MERRLVENLVTKITLMKIIFLCYKKRSYQSERDYFKKTKRYMDRFWTYVEKSTQENIEKRKGIEKNVEKKKKKLEEIVNPPKGSTKKIKALFVDLQGTPNTRRLARTSTPSPTILKSSKTNLVYISKKVTSSVPKYKKDPKRRKEKSTEKRYIICEHKEEEEEEGPQLIWKKKS
jgi:uncharacterized protein YoxC